MANYTRRPVYDPTILSAKLEEALSEIEDAAEAELSFNQADEERRRKRRTAAEDFLSSGSDDWGAPPVDVEDVLYDNGVRNYIETEEIRERAQILGHDERQNQTVPINRRRASLFGRAFIAIIIVAAVALSIKKGIQDKSTKSNGNSSAHTAPKSLAQLPNDFEENCREAANVSGGPVMILGCEQVCGAGACCFEFSSQDIRSCVNGNENICAEYHSKCLSLQSLFDEFQDTIDTVVTVPPPAPEDLADRCAIDIISASDEALHACQQACLPNRCCYDDSVKSCSGESTCYGYSVCGNLPPSVRKPNAAADYDDEVDDNGNNIDNDFGVDVDFVDGDVGAVDGMGDGSDLIDDDIV